MSTLGQRQAGAADVTLLHYSGLSGAFKFFNERLFGGQLPQPLFTLQRKNRMLGYFHESIFRGRDDLEARVDEIALNPVGFARRDDRDILSTIVHEMVHQWQYKFGTAPRSGYHDREWAAKMEEVGLMPSSTGEPGGRKTGQRMDHYIIENSPFDLAVGELVSSGWRLSWEDVRGAAKGLSDLVGITTSGLPIVLAAPAAGGGEAVLKLVDGGPRDMEEPQSDVPWRLDELPTWIQKCAVDPSAATGGQGEDPEGDDEEMPSQVQKVLYKNRPVLVKTSVASTPASAPKKSGVRIKYVCPECRAAVWGKADLKILCKDDDKLFAAV